MNLIARDRASRVGRNFASDSVILQAGDATPLGELARPAKEIRRAAFCVADVFA